MVNMPQFLSKPMVVLWWESDELVIGLLAFFLAFVIGGTIPVVIALIVFVGYGKARKKAGRGFINHLPYILGIKSFQGFPHAYVNKFEE